MVIGIALFVVSLFFTPAWFALVVYIIYSLVTKKSKGQNINSNAEDVIALEVRKLIASGEESTILKHLRYASAKMFAAEHGASMSPYENDPEDDCLIVDMEIEGVEYRVRFQRWMKDQTMLTVNTAEKSRQAAINAFGKDSPLGQLLAKQK